MNTKLSLLVLLVFSVLFLLPCYTNSHHQRETEEEYSAEEQLFECFLRCSKQRELNDEPELSKCERRCVDQYQQRKREEGHERAGQGAVSERDPQQQYKECQSHCARQHRQGQERQYCQERCQWELERQRQGQGGSREHGTNAKKEREQEAGDNPYYFESQRFDSKYRTEQGHIRVLPRFTKKSDLLRGIDNYRVAILEANPNTFVIPHHMDAESVCVVVGGRGTISYVWRNQRQSHNMRRGDVMRIPSGSVVYLTNSDDNERLYVLKFLQPVNTPGRFKEYFGAGGENPESFYRTFSDEILEAAFNIPRDRWEKLFKQQRKGVIIKASKEQIRALSQESETSSRGRTRQEEGSQWTPFNLLEQRPTFSSRYGQLFEAKPEKYHQLRDLDVSVVFTSINNGAMMAPFYNSKSTRLVYVVGGNGRFEMACPHIKQQQTSKHGRNERQEQTRTDVHYERVSARLSVGDAFVIPAGHPVAITASQDSNLQLVTFGIKGSFNEHHFLAGRDNVWNQIESEAKELAFDVPAREVDEVLRSQDESYFLPGPEQKQQKETNVASILDFVGF